MRIGQDVSIQVCRDEGYAVMDYPVKQFKADPINTDCTFTWSLPTYAREEIGWSIGDRIVCTEHILSYKDLWEIYCYGDNKHGVDSMIGDEYLYTENPSPQTLLNLAGDLMSYGALDYDNI
jgi:hypothetical protein